MRREDALAYIKAQMERYLAFKGINVQKPFHCLNPDHPDQNPSMGFDRRREKVHCFSCGADYDVIDVIGIDYGIADYRETFQKACDLFGVTVSEGTQGSAAPPKIPASARVARERATAFKGHHLPPSRNSSLRANANNQNPHPPAQSAEEGVQGINPLTGVKGAAPLCVPLASPEDLTPYFQACHERVSQTDYLKRRGIGEAVARRFTLGFDPGYAKSTGGSVWRALIIPTGVESYVARNTSPGADKKSRYRKHGQSLLFNAAALFEAGKPVFVVEGEIDALSVIEVGGEAIALGSTANAGSFIKLVESRKPARPLLLALDDDPTGRATEDGIAEALKRIDAPFYRVNPYGGLKDANDALTHDRESFSHEVKSAERIEDEAQKARREAYFQNSAAAHLQRFIDGIAESVDTPCVSTGFEKLDAALDGGLYEGLYIVGAISSLGKTTLVSQIADQIAMRGDDVLIFSLEMARSELIAKSISRHTLVNTLENKGDIRNAKTARGITSGRRYFLYSDAERALIQAAISAYGAYAGHIYISEGIGDIGVAQIRQTVENHTLFTGRSPVVIVDYLQILAPCSERATDKQNTDRAVMELKRVSRDFKIPVIGISSFNRANYREAVTMEAYKESGAIEYSSDVLIGLQLKGAGEKEFNATEQKQKNPREIELVVLKNRNGAIGGKIAFEYYPLFNFWKEA